MRSTLTSAAAVVAGLSFATPSNAGIFIALQEAGVNGGARTEVAQDNTAPLFLPGYALFSGQYGTFKINTITGETPPTSINPLDSIAMNTSSKTPGELKVFVSATNIAVPAATLFLSSFTSNLLPAGWTAHLSTYWDAGNTKYATTSQLGDATFSSIGTDIDIAGLGGFSGSISVTGIYDIKSTGSGTAQSSLSIQAIPEPSSLFLLGASLTIMGMFAHRRKAKSRA
jgi:hypothetical protein